MATPRADVLFSVSLTELEKFKALSGFTFEKLPTEPRNALEIRPYVRVITLLKQSDPELKYEVFERLNTGGEALFPQEIRNAAFRGKLNEILFELSKENFLRQQLKISKNTEQAYLQMQDVEYVLRFFTMRESWTNFSGDYRRSMDKFMEMNRNPSAAEVTGLKKLFEETLLRCEQFWGIDAFKRFDGAATRNQFLAGMYDAQMVAVSLLSSQKAKSLASKIPLIRKATRKLFENKEFEGWVRSGTNTRSSVEGRIKAVKAMLESLA